MTSSTTILGVNVTTLDAKAVFAIIADAMDRPDNLSSTSSFTPLRVITPNPEILVWAARHPEYRALLNQADIALPDGQGLVWCSKGAIAQRITGTDMMFRILEHANTHRYKIGIVTRADGLSSDTEIQQAFAKRYPNCALTITHADVPRNVDIIFVALGFPEQEQWLHDNAAKCTGTKLIMTVGGGIDFLTGKQRRAPLLLRRFGVEWLWRLVRQPSRIKRIFTATIVFPYLVLRERLFHTQYE